MSIYSALSLTDSLSCFAIASLVLWRGGRRGWVLVSMLYVLSIWVSYVWLFTEILPHASLSTVRNAYSIAVITPFFLLMFALSTMEKPLWSALTVICFFAEVFFLLVLRSPRFFAVVHVTERGLIPEPGPLFTLFTLYFLFISFYTFSAIVWAQRKANEPRMKNRLKWVAFAFLSSVVGGIMHFLAGVMGYELVPHDLFLIGFAGLLGYAVLRRTLYDIELLTRDAAIRVGIVFSLALPLVLGRLVASRLTIAGGPEQAPMILLLLAVVLFFGAGIHLMKFQSNEMARPLARVLLLWGGVNALGLAWFAPYNPYSAFLARCAYVLGCWSLIAWADYRLRYFHEKEAAVTLRRSTTHRLWRLSAYGLTAFTILSPYVVKNMVPLSDMRLSVVPGPAFILLQTWWLVSFLALSLWIGWRFWKMRVSTQIRWTAFGSMLTGLLAALCYVGLYSGVLQTVFGLSLEILSAALLMMTFAQQPLAGERLQLRAMRQTILSVGLPCLVGLSLEASWWIQVLAAIGLMLGTRRVLTDVEESVKVWVDQYLFREKYSYLVEIRRIADDIFRFTNIPDLLKHLVNDLSARAQLKWAGVWLLDLVDGRYVLRQASDSKTPESKEDDPDGPPPPFTRAPVTTHQALTNCLVQTRGLVIAEESETAKDWEASARGRQAGALEAARELKGLQLAAAFPVFIEKRLIGFIGFGRKDNAAMIHQADQEEMTELGLKAERAIGQAYMLYEQSMMLSKLAHDTLNSLHALGMVLSIIDNELIGPINETQKQQLSIAIHQRQMIEDCLTDLRELERLVMLRMQGAWRMESYDLAQTAQDAVNAFQNRAKQKNILLEGSWGPLPKAIGDPRAVRRVIDNLIVNALKFTPSGGRIDVALTQNGDQNLRLTVADTGAGIPPEEMPRVFDPFYSGPTGKNMAYGTGLGLSVVKEVTALHHGSVHVESAVGVGTTMVVDLPTVARQKEFDILPEEKKAS